MFKKILFVVLMVLVPVGLKAQYQGKPDSMRCNQAQDTCWWFYETGLWWIGDSTYQELDSFFVDHPHPNWQDSIEMCKKEIKYAEERLDYAQKELLDIPQGARLYEEVELAFRTYNDARQQLLIWYLQLQIFQLQAKLGGKE